MLFAKEEYKERLKKVQSSMQEQGIELLISQDTANMNYLTGYDAWSFYYAQCVIIHLNAEEPICFVRAQDAGGAYIKTYLKDENIQAFRAKEKKHIPVVLDKNEVKMIIANVSGIYQVMLKLMYGCGLRMSELLNLRVKDIDFSYNKVYIWDSKSQKDRTVLLPLKIKDELKMQIKKVQELHQEDLKNGFGTVDKNQARIFLTYI